MTFVSLARRVAFIHVPRAGGTSILAALRAGGDGMPLENHLRARDLRARLGGETWESFDSIAVVRESADWFLSKWRYLRSEPRHRLFAAAQGMDFARFARGASYGTMIGARQVDFLCDEAGRPLVRHVLRFERLAEEWERLAERLSIPANVPHVNASVPSAEEALGEEERRILHTIFAEDALRFEFASAPAVRALVSPAWSRIAEVATPGWFDRRDACRELAEVFFELGEFDAARWCAECAGMTGLPWRIPERFETRSPDPADLRALVERIARGIAAQPYVTPASIARCDARSTPTTPRR